MRRRVSLRRAARPPVGPVSPVISGPNGLPGAVPGPGLGMVRTGPRQRGHASVPVHGPGPRARPGCVQADRSQYRGIVGGWRRQSRSSTSRAHGRQGRLDRDRVSCCEAAAIRSIARAVRITASPSPVRLPAMAVTRPHRISTPRLRHTPSTNISHAPRLQPPVGRPSGVSSASPLSVTT